jgi:hypothetical protein
VGKDGGPSGATCCAKRGPLAALIGYYTDNQFFILRPKHMPKPKSFLRVFTESGPLIAK